MINNLSITNIITVATIAITLYAWKRDDIMRKFIFNPYVTQTQREYWRFFTSGFIHDNYMHLGFNMLAFHSFARPIETIFSDKHSSSLGLGSFYGETGPFYFFMLYALAIVFSSIPTYFRHKNNPAYNSLGASGGVSAIVIAFVILLPEFDIQFIFLPFIDIPGVVFATGYLAYSFYADRRGGGRINHSAHLWGGLFGLFFIIIMHPESLGIFIRKVSEMLPF